MSTSTTTNATLQSIHFLPPSTDNQQTAWIIVGIVAGSILLIFIGVLAVRQLLILFKHREYESLTASTVSHKSLFEHYNNGQVTINIDEQSNNASFHSWKPSKAIKSKSKSKSKTKSKSKSKSKLKAKSDRSGRKSTMSESRSTVNFVYSDSEKKETEKRKKSKEDKADENRQKPIVSLIKSDSDIVEEEEDEFAEQDNITVHTHEDFISDRVSRGKSSVTSYTGSSSMGFSTTQKD